MASSSGGDAPVLNPEQQAHLKTFRKMAHEKYSDATEQYPNVMSDVVLTRFLKARNFVPAKAMEQYMEYRTWLHEKKVNRMRTVAPDNTSKHKRLLAYALPGLDKEGHPVYIERLGACHMDTFVKLTNTTDYGTFQAWKKEQIFLKGEQQAERLGVPIYKHIQIVDLKGLNMSHRLGVSFVAEESRIEERFYPETVFKVFIVNPPWVFPALYKLVTPFIDADTQTKTEILSGDVESFGPRLLEFIDADQLPVEYGGVLDVEMPQPDHQALLEEKDAMSFEHVKVAAGRTEKVEITLDGPGLLSWFVRCDKTVDFSCDFSCSGQNHVIKEKERLAVSEGSFAADSGGVAVFTMDNSFSYLQGKTLQHCISFVAIGGAR